MVALELTSVMMLALTTKERAMKIEIEVHDGVAAELQYLVDLHQAHSSEGDGAAAGAGGSCRAGEAVTRTWYVMVEWFLLSVM